MKILSNREYEELMELRNRIVSKKEEDLRVRALENFLVREGYNIPKYQKHYLNIDKYMYDPLNIYLDYFYEVVTKNPEKERKELYIKRLENILKGNTEEESDDYGNDEP